MENKYLKYVLIGVVVIVWGAIIFRVAGGVSGPDATPAVIPHPVKKEVAALPDSFVLFADYPDPFIPEEDTLDPIGGKKTPAPPAGTAPATTTGTGAMGTIPKPAPPPVTSYLQYIGMIGNPEKKLKIAIISLHGQEILLREKEKREDLVVKKIEKDRIQVVYKGKTLELFKGN